MEEQKPKSVARPEEVKGPPGFFRAMFLYDRTFLGVLVVSMLCLGMLAALFFRWIPGHADGSGGRSRLTGVDALKRLWLASQLGEPGAKDFKADEGLWKDRLELDRWDPSGLRGYADSLLQSTNSPSLKWDVVMPLMERLLRTPAMTEDDVRRVLKLGQKVGEEEQTLLALGEVWLRLPAAVRDECLWLGGDLGEWEWVGKRLAQVQPGSDPAKWTALAHQTLTLSGAGLQAAMDQLVRETREAGSSDARLHQLVLQVASLRKNGALGLASYERLKALKADRRVDRVRWVVCLVAAGEVEKAGLEVDRWGADSLIETDVRSWLGAMESVHLLEQALSALEMASIRAGRRDWWLLLAEELIVTKDWIGVRRVGTRFVGGGSFKGEWRAFGYALQAIAAQGAGSEDDLRDAEKWTGLVPVPADRWTMKWALMFGRVGYLKWASPWLLKTQAAFGEDIVYWRMRMRLAEDEGDIKAFLLAVRKAIGLQPKDVLLRIDEANAMLVLHDDPEGALARLETEEAIAEGGMLAQASRAMALIQLGRRTLADGLIRNITPKIRTDAERALVGLARIQLARSTARPQEAWEILKKLDRSKLPSIFLPELEELSASIRPGSPGGGVVPR